jgi:hypothetical protein
MTALSTVSQGQADCWCAAVEGTGAGQVLLSNIVYDCRSGRCPPVVVQELFAEIDLAWSAAPDPDKAVDLIRAVPRKRPSAYFLSGPLVAASDATVARIISASRFVREYIDPSYWGLSFADDVSDELAVLLEGGIPGEAITHHQIPFDRPCAWVSPVSEVNAHVPSISPAAHADRLRNVLGLYHLDAPIRLFQLDYPPNAIPADQLRAPTFIDGGGSFAFRSKVNRNGWGTTVDLETLGDGLPEALHPSVPFGPAFRVTDRGTLSRNLVQPMADRFLLKHASRWQLGSCPTDSAGYASV